VYSFENYHSKFSGFNSKVSYCMIGYIVPFLIASKQSKVQLLSVAGGKYTPFASNALKHTSNALSVLAIRISSCSSSSYGMLNYFLSLC